MHFINANAYEKGGGGGAKARTRGKGSKRKGGSMILRVGVGEVEGAQKMLC